MRVLIDENLPRTLGAALFAAGHDVEDTRDAGLRGRPDSEVFARAVAERRVLLTGDVGFGNVIAYPLGSHAGIVLMRVPTSVPSARLVDLVVRALATLDADDLASGALVVVVEGTMRIRRPPPVRT